MTQLVLPTIGVAQPQEPEAGTLEATVLKALRGAKGMTRPALAFYAGESDRKVREAVEALVLLGWPVVSHSGRAGYSLDWEGVEVDRAIADLEARGQACFERARALKATRERLGTAA